MALAGVFIAWTAIKNRVFKEALNIFTNQNTVYIISFN